MWLSERFIVLGCSRQDLHVTNVGDGPTDFEMRRDMTVSVI